MKLIDKDVLVAEIERLTNKMYYEPDDFKDVGAKIALDCLRDFINTLEVKEVDLEKELADWLGERVGKWTGKECERMCLYFFELGLKASNPLTWEDIKTLQDKSGEVYAEVAKGKDDFYSIYPTEQSFLEEVLKRFKAKTGEKV